METHYKIGLGLCLLAVLALNLVNNPGEDHQRSCSPHPAFLSKHFEQDCYGEKEALEKSHRRFVRFGGTQENTVLCAQGRAAESFGWFLMTKQGESVCSNVEPIPIVYTCTSYNKKCRHKGKHCITDHSSSNGHLFYRDIMCNLL